MGGGVHDGVPPAGNAMFMQSPNHLGARKDRIDHPRDRFEQRYGIDGDDGHGGNYDDGYNRRAGSIVNLRNTTKNIVDNIKNMNPFGASGEHEDDLSDLQHPHECTGLIRELQKQNRKLIKENKSLREEGGGSGGRGGNNRELQDAYDDIDDLKRQLKTERMKDKNVSSGRGGGRSDNRRDDDSDEEEEKGGGFLPAMPAIPNLNPFAAAKDDDEEKSSKGSPKPAPKRKSERKSVKSDSPPKRETGIMDAITNPFGIFGGDDPESKMSSEGDEPESAAPPPSSTGARARPKPKAQPKRSHSGMHSGVDLGGGVAEQTAQISRSGNSGAGCYLQIYPDYNGSLYKTWEKRRPKDAILFLQPVDKRQVGKHRWKESPTYLRKDIIGDEPENFDNYFYGLAHFIGETIKEEEIGAVAILKNGPQYEEKADEYLEKGLPTALAYNLAFHVDKAGHIINIGKNRNGEDPFNGVVTFKPGMHEVNGIVALPAGAETFKSTPKLTLAKFIEGGEANGGCYNMRIDERRKDDGYLKFS